MSPDNQGVVISFKEIYDEVTKTSAKIEGISNRLERVEKKIEKQEDRQDSFEDKIKVMLFSAAIPVILSIIYFVAKGGGL